MATELEKTSSSSSYIPLEVTEIILSKLSSVKSLLRFKAVSKSWNTVISDPVFVQNHLQSSNSPNNNLFLRMDRNSTTDGGNFSLIKFEDRKIRVVESLLKKPNFSKVLCECNGVILLTDSSQNYTDYVLWNPSTQWQMYFKCPYEFDEYYMNPGICYDPVTNDFKVVMIAPNNYAVYSCNNNSWTIQKLRRTEYFGIYFSGIFVDGATFWLVQDYERSRIVYFDPKTEELKNLWLPKELTDGDVHRLASLGGRLCLYSNIVNRYENRVQIWTKEKGVFENYCWNKFITIENMRTWIDTNSMFAGPVCYVGNKIVIRLDKERFFYYFPTEKTLECLEDIDMYGCKIIPYRNSLYFPSRKDNIGSREAMTPNVSKILSTLHRYLLCFLPL